ncbi:MAG: helix-turn-helix domain-containing protein [Alphaproteobacteria bacterium]
MTAKNKRPPLSERVLAAAREAAAHAQGEPSAVVLRVPDSVDVKAIRQRAGLSQAAFAGRFGFSLDSVQNWESGRRQPEGAARILLTVIDREPDAVLRALRAS